MARIAVIGGGIAGLTAAHRLSAAHEVFLLEKEDRLGGHTHTVLVDEPGGPVAVDTGFIVYNERNYPNLVALFAELGVSSQPADMSFSVADRASGFEYSSRGLNGFFADRRNLARGAHYLLLAETLRFHRRARRLAEEGDATGGESLEDWLAHERFTAEFRRRFLYPMASAIWSTSLSEIGAFPVGLLARFFHNHGLLQVTGNPPWRVVTGGSSSYLAPLTASYRDRVITRAGVRTVSRSDAGVAVRLADGTLEADQVVFACHGDEVLPLLERPTPAEVRVFGAFRTSRNETWLHTDSGLLPRRRAARASWNYLLGSDERGVTLTYDMNRLQSLTSARQYCVTLHPEGLVDPSTVIRKMVYRHPLYTRDALRAQAQWGEVNGRLRTHYCGAYWFNGFHEDGVRSALRVAEAIASPRAGAIEPLQMTEAIA
jgi:predicted NAD/FAD-binding protein